MDRVYPAGNVGHFLRRKSPHQVQNRVHLPDVPQKLVAQAFALVGSLDQTGNVIKLHRRRHPFLDFQSICQFS